MLVTYPLVKFINMSLYKMYVVVCIQTSSTGLLRSKKDLVPVTGCGVSCVGECCIQHSAIMFLTLYINFDLLILSLYKFLCQSQWPSSLRRGFAAVRLLELWVRIPPGAWMSIS
jgi:uncharacterized membrane-anchored protein YitT (DUF2179 family)